MKSIGTLAKNFHRIAQAFATNSPEKFFVVNPGLIGGGYAGIVWLYPPDDDPSAGVLNDDAAFHIVSADAEVFVKE